MAYMDLVYLRQCAGSCNALSWTPSRASTTCCSFSLTGLSRRYLLCCTSQHSISWYSTSRQHSCTTLIVCRHAEGRHGTRAAAHRNQMHCYRRSAAAAGDSGISRKACVLAGCAREALCRSAGTQRQKSAGRPGIRDQGSSFWCQWQ